VIKLFFPALKRERRPAMGLAPSRSLKEVLDVVRVFAERGVDFIVVGGAAVSILLQDKSVAADLDLVAFSPDPALEEDFYAELASELGCEMERHPLGGVRLTFSDGFAVDLVSPAINLEVPSEAFEFHEKVKLPSGKEAKVASVELALVLKCQAVAWGDAPPESLREYVSRVWKRVDRSKLNRILDLYDSAVKRAIARVLEEAV